MILYRGSVKDVLGPFQSSAGPAVLFEYTDAYSVFDWGRMPDLLPRKGEALAILAAEWFEKLGDPAVWKEFWSTPAAIGFRKANPFGPVFTQVGEKLCETGLRTHYLGLVETHPEVNALTSNMTGDRALDAKRATEVTRAARHVLMRQVSVTKPEIYPILGRQTPDYTVNRESGTPRLIPLEVVFRFSCPEGSSIIERARTNPDYLASIGYGQLKLTPGALFDVPILELFSKLESTDRVLSLSEGLAISGIKAPALEQVLVSTAWVAKLLRWLCWQMDVELEDGKLEWAIDTDGEVFLVDAIGPDELRLSYNGVQLSKEFLRRFYRATSWYTEISRAKEIAKTHGDDQWKAQVHTPPPHLSARYRELATQLYLTLANRLTGRNWFTGAWDMDRLAQEIARG